MKIVKKCTKTISKIFTSKHRSYSSKSFNDIPGPKPSLPLIGTAWQYFNHVGNYKLTKLHEANMEKYKHYGPIVKEEFEWRKPVVFLFEPNDFEIVFRYQGKYPLRPPNQFVCHYREKAKHLYANPGLSNLNGKEWYKQRQFLASLTTKSVIRKSFFAQNEISESFVKFLATKVSCDDDNKKSGHLENFENLIYCYTLEALCMFSLNTRINCLLPNVVTEQIVNGEQLITLITKLFRSYQHLYYGIPVWKISPLLSSAYREYADIELKFFHLIDEYINNYRAKFINNEFSRENNGNIIDELLQSQISDNELKVIIIDLISGGVKTLSTTLIFLFHHLAINENVQEKLFEEIISVMNSEKQLTLKHIDSLTYLKACVKETFRLSSIIPCVVRTLHTDLTLSGYIVPSGTTVFATFYVPSHLDKYFEDPFQFKPERWLRDTRRSINPFTVLPFGCGTRQCPGRWFSEFIMYILTANVILKYKLSSLQKTINSKQSFIIEPESAINLHIKER